MRQSMRALGACAVLAVMTVACGDDGGRSSSSTTAPAIVETPVVVTNAGAEPRQLLRLALKKGQEFRQTNVVTQAIDVAIDAQTQHLDQSVTTVTKMTVTKAEKGRFTIEVVFEDIRSTGGGSAQPLDELKGVGWTMVLDDRGTVVDVQVDDSKVTSPAVQQVVDTTITSLRQSAFVLPEEPVGVGAVWTHERQVLASGIPLAIAQTTTVTGLDAGTVSYSLTATYRKGDGEYQIPNLPAGASVADAAIGGNVEGAGTLATAFPLPNITTTSNLDVALSLTKDGQLKITITKLDQKVESTVTAI